MEPAWHNGLRIGLPVLALGIVMMLDLWLTATNPSRPRLKSCAVWNLGSAFALLPELLLGDMTPMLWAVVVPIFGTSFWGLMKLGMWLRYDLPYRQAVEATRHEQIQKYHPTSFGD